MLHTHNHPVVGPRGDLQRRLRERGLVDHQAVVARRRERTAAQKPKGRDGLVISADGKTKGGDTRFEYCNGYGTAPHSLWV